MKIPKAIFENIVRNAIIEVLTEDADMQQVYMTQDPWQDHDRMKQQQEKSFNAKDSAWYDNHYTRKADSVSTVAHQKSVNKKAGMRPVIGRFPDGSPNYGLGCMYTASDNYGEKVMSIKAFESDPAKYGFKLLPQGSELKKGDLIIKLVDNMPWHAMIFDGYDENGTALVNDYDGFSEDLHYNTHSPRYYLKNLNMFRAYRYIGKPQEREAWKKDYDTNIKPYTKPIKPLPVKPF
jgi:hypothetical protein